MKKLVVLLASAMMFSFSATAFAFTDMADQTAVVNDAVNKAAALEIIEGYQDGTFRPDATITRAEFAKIAVTAAGAQKTATMLEGTSSEFSDVATGAWYTGWINAAASLGLVQGDQGAYRPNETITNGEVTAVLLRLLGYNDNLTGTWPTNYITQANKLEVLDDVTVLANVAATRGDVAVILDAILGETMVKYSKDTESFVDKTYIDDNKEVKLLTLLKDSFKGAIEEKVALDVVTLKDAEDLTFNIKEKGVTSALMTAVAGEVVVDSSADLLSLDGHLADIIYKVVDGKPVAKYVDITSTSVVTGDVEYKAGETTIKVDGKKYDVETAFNANIDDSDRNLTFTVFINDDDEVYAVSSDADTSGTHKVYFAESLSSFIEEVDEDEISTLGTLVDGASTFEFDAEEQILVNAETGMTMAVEDLKAGMVLTNYYNSDDIILVSEAQTAEFTKATTSKYTLGGTAYKIAGVQLYDQEYEYDTNDAADYLGEEVTYFVNADNTVTEIITGEAGDAAILYGVIVDSTETTGSLASSNIQDVTIFTQEGKTVTYELTKEAAKTVIDSGAKFEGKTASALGAFVAYKLNSDGEIKEIKEDHVDTLTGSIDVKEDKYLFDGTDTYTLASDVVIFNIGEDDGDLAVSLITRADLLAKDDFEAKDVDLNVKHEDDELAAYLAIGKMTGSNIKVMAGTEIIGSSSAKFGVVDAIGYNVKDITGAVSIKGDDNDYELGSNANNAVADQVVKYTISGNTLNIEAVEADMADAANFKLVKYINDGVLTEANGDKIAIIGEKTQVFKMNADGEYSPASVEDLKAKVYAYEIKDEDNKYSRIIIMISADDKADVDAALLADAKADLVGEIANALTVVTAAEDDALTGAYVYGTEANVATGNYFVTQVNAEAYTNALAVDYSAYTTVLQYQNALKAITDAKTTMTAAAVLK